MLAALGLFAANAARADTPASSAAPAATSTAAPALTSTAAPGVAASPPGSAAANKPKAASGAAESAAPPTAPRLEPARPQPAIPDLPKHPVKWREDWPKFRVAEYIATPLLGVGVFAARTIPPQPNNWRHVSDFDVASRNAIRIGSPGGRNTADDASDLILGLMVNQLLVDATLVAWWGHNQSSVGYQMLLIDLEALALTGALQAVVSAGVSRWRPFRDTCVGPVEDQTQDCQDNKQFTSFWSGHTSGAFTVAGLMCMHHAHVPLYGGGVREALTCAASFAAAASVGYLRMAADQHFMTDVLVGAAIGTMSGLGVPWLLHYRGGATPEKKKKSGSQVSFRVLPTPVGLSASGEF